MRRDLSPLTSATLEAGNTVIRELDTSGPTTVVRTVTLRPEERWALAEFLAARRGSRVEVRVPERGEKRRLQELAQQNAALALESETFVAERSAADRRPARRR